ncbi:MAG: pteridine reductase [Gammaproteobacteria bacterium]|nr:MAG: pteridine reductase [Gammaproteobacteria bacterium]
MNDINLEKTQLPVALITGSARRIGAVIARLLHQNHHQIIIHCNHSLTEAEQLASELNDLRAASALVIKADLSTSQGCNELIEAVLEDSGMFKGRLDVLVNNASAFYPTAIGDVTDSDWQQLFSTNLKAPFILAQGFSASLKQNFGSIINITDIHGERPLAGYSVYSMSKAGLISMTLSLAKELAPNIRVNGVSPGAILWPEADEGDLQKQQKVLAKIPLTRMGAPMNIAQTVLFLLKNDYITGQTIKVDGGRSL